MCWALSFLKKALPPRTAPWPDSQILQPKFNFQLLLTLERERKKQVRKVEECVREREGGSGEGRECSCISGFQPTGQLGLLEPHLQVALSFTCV